MANSMPSKCFLWAVLLGYVLSNEILEAAKESKVKAILQLGLIGRVPLGIILLATGSLFLVTGKYFLRLVMFIVGIVLFGWLGYLGTLLIVPSIPDEEKIHVLLMGMIISSIVGGLIGVFFIKLSTVLLGGALGAASSVLLLRLQIIPTTAILYVMTAILVIGSMALGYFFNDILVMVSTSVVGALLFVLGLDAFLMTGFSDFVTTTSLDSITQPEAKVLGMMGSGVLLAIVGAVIQFKFFWRRNKSSQ